LNGLASRSGVNPNAQLAASSFPVLPANDIPTGAWIASPVVTTLGTASVSGAGGGRADLVISLGTTGTVTFGGSFNAPTAQLYLLLGSGFAQGQINVRSLQVEYSQTEPTLKTVDLLGSVSGESGSSAASASYIQPKRLNNYQLNNCPIQSVNCIRIVTLSPPVTNPLRDLQVAPVAQPDDFSITLPDVGEKDY
jgi:hypothetical protein